MNVNYDWPTNIYKLASPTLKLNHKFMVGIDWKLYMFKITRKTLGLLYLGVSDRLLLALSLQLAFIRGQPLAEAVSVHVLTPCSGRTVYYPLPRVCPSLIEY